MFRADGSRPIAPKAAGAPPTVKGQQTRQLIIECSSRLFDRQGFAATSLSQLVASTGLTRGAFYFHFESKDALAVAIVEAQVQRWPVMRTEVRKLEPDPLRALLTFAFRAAFAVQSDPVVRAANRLMRDRAQIRQEFPETFSWWTGTVEQFLAEAAGRGELPDLSHLVPSHSQSEPESAPAAAAAAGRRHLAERIVAAWLGYQLVAGTDADRRADLLFTSWMTLIPQLAVSRTMQEDLCHLLEHLTRQLRTAQSS